MDKDFILKYLKIEHLAGNEGLLEIAEESGIDVVKLLLKNHETLHLYIPKITTLTELMEDVVKANEEEMNKRQLQKITNITRRTISEYLQKIHNGGA